MEGQYTQQTQTPLQKRIVCAAAELFAEKGIRDVTMDDVSHRLRISKRTLYQVIRDKEELVLICYRADVEAQEESIRQGIADNDDVMSIILKQVDHRLAQMDRLTMASLADFAKYPRLVEAVHKRHRDTEEFVLQFIETGVQQGLLSADVDYRLLLRTMRHMAGNPAGRDDLQGYSPREVFMTMFFTILRGCATDRGRQRLDTFRPSSR